MRKHDRRRHQFRRLITRIPKHNPLIPSALLSVPLSFSLLRIHSLSDVRRLRRQNVLHENFVCMKDIVIIYIANPPHRVPRDLDIVQFRFRRNLPTHNRDVAFHIGLTRHAALRIHRQAGV